MRAHVRTYVGAKKIEEKDKAEVDLHLIEKEIALLGGEVSLIP